MSASEFIQPAVNTAQEAQPIDIEAYISQLIDLLKDNFGRRLLYVGLQGSYLRCEATENSDLDIMVVLDELTVVALDTYRSIIQSLPYSGRSCGFICGRSELLNWNPLEICHLLHSTRDYYHALASLVPPFTEHDVRNFVKMSVNNLYHGICHRYIHADTACNTAQLPGAYKSVFFILQNLHYLQSGVFLPTKAALLERCHGKHKAVLQRSIDLSRGAVFDFEDSYTLLFSWCQEVMAAI